MAAFFKQCAEKWLLQKETNKVSNAIELVHAVFGEGGPKNTKICVLEIDKSVVKLYWDLSVTSPTYHIIIVSNFKTMFHCIENISILAEERFMTIIVCGMVTFSVLLNTLILQE